MITPLIRQGTVHDRAAIAGTIEAAFGQPDEADLVARLRQQGAVTVELVAEHAGAVSGHILFSRVAIEAGALKATALAPVSVLPAHQGLGIGVALIQAGLARLRDAGEDICFVLGEPDYYRRFGFDPALGARFSSPWDGSYFMALALRELDHASLGGRVVYAAPFIEPG